MGADRSLQSIQEELSVVIKSRKRKLRELHAVRGVLGADGSLSLPRSFRNLDAEPTTLEAQFLDACDITQNRRFDTSYLPLRRQLRSDTSRQREHGEGTNLAVSKFDGTRKAAKLGPDGSGSRKSGTSTPGFDGDTGKTTGGIEGIAGHDANNGMHKEGTSSKSSQSDRPMDFTIASTLHATTETDLSRDNQTPSATPGVLHHDLERGAKRRGLDSRRGDRCHSKDASPDSAEEFVKGHSSVDATNADVKSRQLSLRDAKEVPHQRGGWTTTTTTSQTGNVHLSINLPTSGPTEQISSPGSTQGALTATTPALHEGSADTSPDGEGSRFDPDRDKEDGIRTPVHATPFGEIAEEQAQAHLLQAQLGVEPEAVAVAGPSEVQAGSGSESYIISTGVDVEDRNEHRTGYATVPPEELSRVMAEDKSKPDDVEAPLPQHGRTRLGEIPDSEAEHSREGSRDVVHAGTPKDSYGSSTPVGDPLRSSTAVSQPARGPAKVTTSISKSTSSTPAASPVLTPKRTPSVPNAPPERMTTRVQSGAIRNRSVAEILEGTSAQRPTVSSAERTARETAGCRSGSITPQTPIPRNRITAEKAAKEKERSKLSTVVFPKQQPKPNVGGGALVLSSGNVGPPKDNDYMLPMFISQAHTDRKDRKSLDSLVLSAAKTLTTADRYAPLEDLQMQRTLKRIYKLQVEGKWSLRQPKRSEEPNREFSHWDMLLREAKWMRTDFREERKWKAGCAKNMAYWCAEWLVAEDEERAQLRIKARPQPKFSYDWKARDADHQMSGHPHSGQLDLDGSSLHSHPTPDLIASTADSPMDDFDEDELRLTDIVSPKNMFNLGPNEVIFHLQDSPTAKELLDQLPWYNEPLSIPAHTEDIWSGPDRHWQRRTLPISKYLEGDVELQRTDAPRKKSRFEYSSESDDEVESPLAPESNHVALFDPTHKHIRDRIHAGHQFRPPSEFPMPMQSFFETRMASQWTEDEDDDLKFHVRKYSYNWSLISNILSSPSAFCSGAERRTPWECFERWINLEGLPADMGKTAYFRAYTHRIDTAQRTLMLAAQGPPVLNANGQPQPPRRRNTTSFRVEKRRNNKHLTMIDAMRKTAKKRENTLQKQQLAASQAAQRERNAPGQARAPAHTPQDFSRLKHERDEAARERMVQYQLRQQELARRVQQPPRNAPAGSQQQGAPNSIPSLRGGGIPSAPGLAPPNGLPPINQHLAIPGTNRPPRPPQSQQMGQVPNSLRMPPQQMPPNGIPQAQMQGPGSLPQPNPNPVLDINLMDQARRMASQQRQQVQVQQQQGHIIQNSPPRNIPPGLLPNMPAYNANGMVGSPNLANGSPGQAGSPRPGQAMQNMPNGIWAQAHAQVRQQFPNAPHAELVRRTQERISAMNQYSQSAMNAAAGSSGQAQRSAVGLGSDSSPQMYSQMLANHHRQQSQGQQNPQVNGGQGSN